MARGFAGSGIYAMQAGSLRFCNHPSYDGHGIIAQTRLGDVPVRPSGCFNYAPAKYRRSCDQDQALAPELPGGHSWVSPTQDVQLPGLRSTA